MYFGENPDKVKNIVTKALGPFQELYAPAIKVRRCSSALGGGDIVVSVSIVRA